MFKQIKECGNIVIKNIDNILRKNSSEIEVRNFLGNYSTDVIGTCALSLKLNIISDNKSAFHKYGKVIFIPSLSALFRELCLLITPALLKIIKVKDFPTKATDFFHTAFKETIKPCLYTRK